MKRIFALILLFVPALAAAQIRGLDAPGPARAWTEQMMLFGQFVGDWECDVVRNLTDGSSAKGRCEWHFGWTLEGRAVQDVWIAHYDNAKPDFPADTYGTTVRWHDPKTDVWHVIWINPRENSVQTFTAHKTGEDIVLEAQDNSAHPYRWIFSEITPGSFHWRSVASADGGKTWRVDQEMSVRRLPSKPDPTLERDRQTILRLEQEWLNAESDGATLERLLADDFLHPVAAGVFLDKRQHIDWSVQHPRPAGRKAKFERLDVRLYGNVAIATGIVADADASGDNLRRSIFTDVFAQRQGQWQAVSAEENALAPMR